MKFFFFVTTIASYLGISLACSCLPPTQQTTWCSADWVSKVTVKSRTGNNMAIHYTVTQDEIFKGGNNLPNDVFSASSSAACGETMLQVGKSYLLAGFQDDHHTLTINSCTIMPLSDNHFGGPLEWTLVLFLKAVFVQDIHVIVLLVVYWDTTMICLNK
uniref:NTR domain-containing protein n=1 Tax=Acrobeloides nanus TaxID=290746 RepID=A0A914E5T8_9BILA